VIACNESGVWSKTPATLAVIVLPYFWQTWWFVPGCVVLAILTLGGGILYAARFRWQREVKRLEVQLSIAKERGRIAQDIHDGVGANLTEIAWLAELAEKEAANLDNVRAHSRRISATARETVQSFDEIVWAVLPENDTLTRLVEYLGRRVDEMFENTNIQYRFSAPNNLPGVIVPADVRHSFFLACKEALHNVIQHSRASNVRVQVTFQESTLEINIDDDGRGFDPTALPVSGNGLHNLRNRFETLGGRFDLQSRPGGGTRVRMILLLKPVKPA
jgi:signal transduction histidine kinase